MLQVALLLLGCALFLYLWEIDVTVACVVLSVTALEIVFYVFVVVAGTAFTSCPYQTPGARALRHILHHILPPIPGLLHSTFHNLVGDSLRLSLFSDDMWGGWWNLKRNISLLFLYILCSPFLVVGDAYQLAWAMARAVITLACRVRNWISSARFAPAREFNQRVAGLDLQCIAWILQTSLEKGTRLAILKFLATTPTLVDFSLFLVQNCFDIFIDCIKVNKRNAVIVQEMEQLAEASIVCFFLTYSHLSIMDPASSILADIRQHYKRIFPRGLNFSGLPLPHTLGTIHEAIYSWEVSVPIEWANHKPTNHEHVIIAHAISKLSWSESQRGRVPPLCLSFALHYLSQDPLPPPSIIADCLLIIAIDMRFNVPNTMVSGERYAHTSQISTALLTNSQCTT